MKPPLFSQLLLRRRRRATGGSNGQWAIVEHDFLERCVRRERREECRLGATGRPAVTEQDSIRNETKVIESSHWNFSEHHPIARPFAQQGLITS